MPSFIEVESLISNAFVDAADVRLAIVFGSVARGEQNARSDIDIGVLGGDLQSLRVVLAHACKTDRIDLVDLQRASPLLAMAVAMEGRVVLERTPGTHAQFVSLAFRRYCDTAKLRAARRDQIDDFVTNQSRGPS